MDGGFYERREGVSEYFREIGNGQNFDVSQQIDACNNEREQQKSCAYSENVDS